MTDWKTVPTEAKPLPCPCCAGRARKERKTGRVGVASPCQWMREIVSCKSCGLSVTGKRPNEAVSRWNRRASPPAPAGDPVAWMVTDKVTGDVFVYRAKPTHIADPEWLDDYSAAPLYTNPLDVVAIRAEAQEEAARLIEAQHIVHTSDGDELAPRMEGNRAGLAYAFAIRALSDKRGAEGWRPLDPDMPAQEMRLHMGEMTAQEMRAARAAIRWANSRFPAPPAGGRDGE